MLAFYLPSPVIQSLVDDTIFVLIFNKRVAWSVPIILHSIYINKTNSVPICLVEAIMGVLVFFFIFRGATIKEGQT